MLFVDDLKAYLL